MGDESVIERSRETRNERDTEELVEEMVALEDDLLAQRDSEVEGDDTDEESESETTDEFTTGEILRVGRQERAGHVADKIEVEYVVGGDSHTDEFTWPGDLDNPNEKLTRLTRLCDVEPGKVADLRGCEVPVKDVGYTSSEYEILLPSTATQPALTVFRLWWALKRRGVLSEGAKKKQKIVATSSLVAYTLYLLWLPFANPQLTFGEYAHGALPFIPETLLIGTTPGIVLGGALLVFTGASSILIAAVACLLTIVGVLNGWDRLTSRVSPF